MPSAAQGSHGSGAPGFTPAEADTVCNFLRGHVGPAQAITIDAIYQQTGVQGRRVRAILAYADAELFLLGESYAGVFICATQEDAFRYDHRTTSQIRTMLQRRRRRNRFKQQLPHAGDGKGST